MTSLKRRDLKTKIVQKQVPPTSLNIYSLLIMSLLAQWEMKSTIIYQEDTITVFPGSV